MKAYKLTVLVIDHDELGQAGITDTLEQQKYPNRCMAPIVMSCEEAEIGEWSDDHPLNWSDRLSEEFERLFP